MTHAGLSQIPPFVHPGLAWAALAAGVIPVLVHLINRRRFRKVPWAAMSFLLAANRRSAKRMRLEQFLLMAVRIAIVLLAGFAIARPFIPDNQLMTMRSSRVHRIVVLDNSLSMQAKRPDGRTRFEVARAVADRLIAAFPPADGVSVVTLADPAETVIAHAGHDRRFVKDKVASIRVTQRSTDVVGGLTRALRIVRESDAPLGNRVVYLISDFSMNSWHSDAPTNPPQAVRKVTELFDALGGRATDLNFLRIEPGSSENVAVTGISLQSPLLGLHVPVRFAVEVTNFGPTSARDVSLQVRREGQILRRQSLSIIAPGESSMTQVSMEFSTPGNKLIEARVGVPGGDALTVDDVRYSSVDVRQSTPVLIVDGRPGARLLDGQAGFLSTALAPPMQTASSGGVRQPSTHRTAALIDSKVISEPELGSEVLGRHDVIALCNVPGLSREQWRQLEVFVRAGGGLLITLGELVSAENYNRYGFADGKGLLPGRLGRPTELFEEGTDRLGFRLDAHPHKILAEFIGHPTSGLFLARVDRYVPIQLDPQRAEVLLRYTNDEPAFASAEFGAGRVMIWTTTVNMDWTNLPGKGDFVAVMVEAAAFLAPPHGEHRNLTVGQMLNEPLSSSECSLPMRITVGDKPARDPTVVPDGDGLSATFGPPESADAVSLMVGDSTRLFAVNTPVMESDLRCLDGAQLAAAVSRPINVMSENEGFGVSAAGRSTELSTACLLIVVVLLFGEPWMARRFSSPHSTKSRRPMRTANALRGPA